MRIDKRLIYSTLAVIVAAIVVVSWWWSRLALCPARPARSSIVKAPVAPSPQTRLPTVNTESEWFHEVTAESGIDFSHRSGTSSEKPFPAANGSGVAVLDFDLDGNYDLYFASGTPFPIDLSRRQPGDCFYRNLGGWRFADGTAAAGLGHLGYSAGIAVADYDADGFPDFYLTCYGANCLYRNHGDGTFSRVEKTAGVADASWGTSAAFLDSDNDGLLDIYVCSYAKWTLEANPFCGDEVKNVRIYCSPTAVESAADIFYRNRGDGTFADQTTRAGLNQRAGRAQGVVAADVNNDGAIDLYIGNDMHANSLFLNKGDGSFRDATESSGVGYSFEGVMQAGMGVDAADVNGDGYLDLFVTNFRRDHNALYENNGHELFQEVSHRCGLGEASMPWVGWGTVFADFDLDGWLDLVVTNGHVDDNRHLLGEDAPYAEPPGAWKNDGGKFQFLGAVAGEYFAEQHVGRGLAASDLDNDGDVDLIIGHQDGQPALLRNERLAPASAEAASIILRLVGTQSNRDAIGASVTLQSDDRQQLQPVIGGGSYLSAHDLRRVFAVQPNEKTVRFEIRWPSGRLSTVENLITGREYVIIEPLDPATAARVSRMP